MQKDSKKIALCLVIGLFAFALFLGSAKADITVQIEVKDAAVGGTSLKGQSVPLNTIAYIFGAYWDDTNDEDGSYSMKVWYSTVGWTGPWTQENEWTGTVSDGATISKQWTMNKLGYYKFTWNVTNSYDEGLVSTKVGPVIPEIPFGTIMATVASFAALGVLIKKKRF